MNPFAKDPDEIYRTYQKFRKRDELDKAYRCLENLVKQFPDDPDLLDEIVALALGQMRDPNLARPWLMHRIKLLEPPDNDVSSIHLIAGFDFFVWLVMQKAYVAESVCFDIRNPKTDKFTYAEVMRRYESILQPGCALLGMDWHEGSAEESGAIQYGPYTQPDLNRLPVVVPRAARCGAPLSRRGVVPNLEG